MTSPLCPKCQSENTCEILYGMQDYTDELDRELESRKVHLGGCVMDDDSPVYHCNTCNAHFNAPFPNIYLDIDGVLLANELHPANHASKFLKYVLTYYPDNTYWLTTHCQGNASIPIKHICHLFDAETVELMKQIKPTTWDLAKTRAINFDQPFLWFDDDLFYEEKQTLIQHNALDNWIQVDLAKDPDQLAKFIYSFPIPANK
jgi:hypothetical protein